MESLNVIVLLFVLGSFSIPALIGFALAKFRKSVIYYGLIVLLAGFTLSTVFAMNAAGIDGLGHALGLIFVITPAWLGYLTGGAVGYFKGGRNLE